MASLYVMLVFAGAALIIVLFRAVLQAVTYCLWFTVLDLRRLQHKNEIPGLES